jgi:hypothetical protein
MAARTKNGWLTLIHSSFTIVHNDLAPGEVVNFKVALKDDAKKVKFVQVLPTWTP